MNRKKLGSSSLFNPKQELEDWEKNKKTVLKVATEYDNNHDIPADEETHQTTPQQLEAQLKKFKKK